MTWHTRFFWLLILFFPTQLGVHFWPAWAMVLGRRVDYLSPIIYLTDILVVCTVASYIIFNFQPARPAGGFLIFNKFSKFFLIFLLFASLNIFFAANKPVAIYKWIKVGEFILLGWYILRTKPTIVSIVTPLSIGVFYSSIIAIMQFVFQHSIGGPLWWLGERTFDVGTPGIARTAWYDRELLRPYATFPHPNVLGGFLAAVLPLVLFKLSNYPIIQLSNKKKIFYLVTFLLGVVTLSLTFSRSAIVVGLIAIAVTIIRIRNYAMPAGRQELRILVITLCVIILTSYFIIYNSTEESVVVRQQLNAAAVKLWVSSPLFGVGLGNFLVRLPEALPTRTIYFLQPVHNIYLLVLAEIGIVGLLLLVWYLQKMFRKPLSIWHLAFGILLVLGLVDHYPVTLQQGQLLLTILAAISLNEVPHSAPTPAGTLRGKRKVREVKK